MAALVRVSGPPNSNFLVGYPGISATLVCEESAGAITDAEANGTGNGCEGDEELIACLL